MKHRLRREISLQPAGNSQQNKKVGLRNSEPDYYKGENETYIEASAENGGSVLYDKEIRDKPRTRRTKRNV